jgi:hypothetical protein
MGEKSGNWLGVGPRTWLLDVGKGGGLCQRFYLPTYYVGLRESKNGEGSIRKSTRSAHKVSWPQLLPRIAEEKDWGWFGVQSPWTE